MCSQRLPDRIRQRMLSSDGWMTTHGNGDLMTDQDVLDATRHAALLRVPEADIRVVRSTEKPWEWALQIRVSTSLPRHLYWHGGQWHVTMPYNVDQTDEVFVLEPIASAGADADAVDVGVAVACAAAGSAALDIVERSATRTGSDELSQSLAVLGQALAVLDEFVGRESGHTPEARSLAGILRSEWLIGRLDASSGDLG